LRASEVIHLHWDDVTATAAGYKIKIVGKGGQVRFNQLSASLYQELKAVSNSGYILKSNGENPYLGLGLIILLKMSPNGQDWRKRCRSIGCAIAMLPRVEKWSQFEVGAKAVRP